MIYVLYGPSYISAEFLPTHNTFCGPLGLGLVTLRTLADLWLITGGPKAVL